MDKLDQVRIVLQVAEMGSFIKAAHALDVPRATVSAAVQQLEAGLGTRLLHRTTRQVQLTADGVLLLERGRRLLAEADELDRLFRRRDRDVIGRLNVDVPSRIARRVVAPALPSLFRRYPKLQLSLGSTDRSIDLVQEGVDCAIRVGRLADSSLVVRPLGQFTLINCATTTCANAACPSIRMRSRTGTGRSAMRRRRPGASSGGNTAWTASGTR